MVKRSQYCSETREGRGMRRLSIEYLQMGAIKGGAGGRKRGRIEGASWNLIYITLTLLGRHFNTVTAHLAHFGPSVDRCYYALVNHGVTLLSLWRFVNTRAHASLAFPQLHISLCLELAEYSPKQPLRHVPDPKTCAQTIRSSLSLMFPCLGRQGGRPTASPACADLHAVPLAGL